MLQLLLVVGQGTQTIRREEHTENAHSSADTPQWLYHINSRVLSNEFRASLTVGTPRQDEPSPPQACIKSTHYIYYPRSFVRSFILPCGPHHPPLLPWLLDCSLAFGILLTSAVPSSLSSIIHSWILIHHTSNSRGRRTVIQTKSPDGNVVVCLFSRSCVYAFAGLLIVKQIPATLSQASYQV